MKGPDPKCPNCGMPLTQKSSWKEEMGILWETVCEHCGWEED